MCNMQEQIVTRQTEQSTLTKLKYYKVFVTKNKHRQFTKN